VNPYSYFVATSLCFLIFAVLLSLHKQSSHQLSRHANSQKKKKPTQQHRILAGVLQPFYSAYSSHVYHLASWRRVAALICIAIAGLSLLGLCLYKLYSQNTLPSWALVVSCILSLFTLISYGKLRLYATILLLPPICILLICWDIITYYSAVFMPASPLNILGNVHIFSAAFGQALSILSCVISALILWKQHHLKHKHFISALTSAVPSLQKLHHMLSTSLYVGLVSFSVALISGLYYATTLPSPLLPFLKAKVLWSVGVWCYYVYVIILKNRQQVSQQRLAKLCVWGFLWFTVVFFGILIAF